MARSVGSPERPPGRSQADEHRLRAAGVPAGAQHAHAGHDLDLAVHLGQLAGGTHRIELLDLHDALHPQLVTVSGLGLVALDDVAGVGNVGCAPALTMPPAWS